MTLSPGDRLPRAAFIEMGEAGPAEVTTAALLGGRRVALFGVPGAFTPTCHSAHLPSFIRSADALRAKGVDEIACVAVNDPYVMRLWGAETGATAAGIRMLADADAAFTRAIGMAFDAAAVGLIARSRRYAMLVEDAVVKVLNIEESRGTCEISAGETLLAAI